MDELGAHSRSGTPSANCAEPSAPSQWYSVYGRCTSGGVGGRGDGFQQRAALGDRVRVVQHDDRARVLHETDADVAAA